MNKPLLINKRLYVIFLLVTVGILLVPLIAMQFTDEVAWAPIDFVLATFLILMLMIGTHYLWTNIKATAIRVLSCLLAVFLFLLIWAELAVGILN